MSERRSQGLAALDLAVPARVKHYRLGERIGAGTCGVVHRAIDERKQASVAVKLSPASDDVDAPRSAHGNDVRPKAQRAFESERSAGEELRHPDIVRVLDTGRDAELNFIVMEYVDGTTLRDFCRGPRRLPSAQALAIGVRAGRALHYAHVRGVLHRDVKPANIMLGRDGRICLLDFGIATAWRAEEAIDAAPSVLGTPNYMAPEQVRKQALSPQTDQYGLAAIVYELLTGQRLFRARDVASLFRQIAHATPPDLCATRADLPRSLARVLARALAKRPDQRYPDAAAFAAALEPYLITLRALERRSPALAARMRSWCRRPTLSGFSEFELTQLLHEAEIREVNAGDPLLGARRDPTVAIVVSGGGRRRYGGPAATLAPGDIVGADAARLPGGSRVDAIAERRTVLLEVCGAAYRRLPPTIRALCLEALATQAQAPSGTASRRGRSSVGSRVGDGGANAAMTSPDALDLEIG